VSESSPKNDLCSKGGVNLQELSDEELVKICQEQLPHELQAYKVLVQRYEGLVYNLCMKFLGSPEDAEEIAQDSLLQVFHKIHQFQGRSAFKTWLYKIVHNFCRNRISKIIRKREVQESYEEHAKEELPNSSFEDKRNEEKSAHIQEALDKLKPKEKEIIVYKFISGMTLQEIADVTDVGVSAAKMRYYRALESFKEAYERVSNSPLPTRPASENLPT